MAVQTIMNPGAMVSTTARAASAYATAVHHAPVTARRTHPTEAQRRQFEKLILPHEQSLYAPAMALTHSASDAEDLVQETLVRAYDRFDTFRADGSPRAWLHTIMRNLFFNAYRKRSREPKQVSLEFFDPATSDLSGSGAGIASRVAPNQPTSDSPERQVISEMEGSAVLEAVRNLPADYRQVVAMADIQGMPYQDIADRLNIPIGTVRSRLSRGRERVRRAVFSWRPTGETERSGVPVPA
ncbi:MAG: sigma-70 family RNA polymerase sigma factor [Capsulimonadales bacterium]|nr:sigma-70 family RNA polymerase sigma factor [Capsulimonadales bacterium]